MFKNISRRTAFYCHAGVMFASYFAMGVFLSVLTLYLADSGLSMTDLSFVTSGTAVFTIVMQPLIGMAADRFGKPKRLVGALWVVCLAAGMGFLVTHSVPLLFVMNGVAQAIIIATCSLVDNMILDAKFNYGTIRMWGSIGYALSVQVSGLVYDYVSHDAVFWIFGAMMLLSLVLLQAFAPGEKKAVAKDDSVGFISTALHTKGFLVFLFINFAILGMHYCNITFMPILVEEMGGTATNVGTILLLQSLGEIPLLAVSQKIIDKLGKAKCMLVISLLMALRWVLYASHISLGWMISLFFFQALTACLFFVVSLQVTKEIIPPQYCNTAIAVTGMAGKGVANLCFQLTGGQLMEAGGTSLLYIFLTIIAVITAVASVMYGRIRKEIIA